ncbi:MAG: TlpA disulfide reductase family protein [Vicinamibacterales bacterium]
MRRRPWITVAGIVGVLALWPPIMSAPPAPADARMARSPALPASAFEAFNGERPGALVAPMLDRETVTDLIAALDRLLAADVPAGARAAHDGDVLWQFARRLQGGLLGPGQERRVVTHLSRVAAERPESAPVVERAVRMIERLSVGKTAPEITGLDLEGRPFRLSDYRERVVVLVFSADWCAICRTQLPYERFLADQYANWPFALLGVETGAARETALAGQRQHGVPHRAWWDAPGEGAPDGQIAADWNVIGWPATYLIDADGVIRFVDLRDEDLLKGVRQLLGEQADREAGRSPR